MTNSPILGIQNKGFHVYSGGLMVTPDDGALHLIKGSGSKDYSRLMRHRTPVDADEIRDNGFYAVSPNLGVNCLLTGTKGDTNYILLAVRKEVDDGKLLATLFQGYAEVENDESLANGIIRGIGEELAEECLLVGEDGKVLGFKFDGKNLDPHFSKAEGFQGVFPKGFSEERVEVQEHGAKYGLPAVEFLNDIYEGSNSVAPLMELNVYVEGLVGAIQVGTSAHISLDEVAEIHSSEQSRNSFNGCLLEDRLNPHGVLLIRVGDDRKLTSEVLDGAYNPVPSKKVLLPEAFDLHKRGDLPWNRRVIPVTNGKSIPLDQFVQEQ
jgi:hypothetical protein